MEIFRVLPSPPFPSSSVPSGSAAGERRGRSGCSAFPFPGRVRVPWADGKDTAARSSCVLLPEGCPAPGEGVGKEQTPGTAWFCHGPPPFWTLKSRCDAVPDKPTAAAQHLCQTDTAAPSPSHQMELNAYRGGNYKYHPGCTGSFVFVYHQSKSIDHY